ncbi:hypothetical protein O3P69_012172 [Scylla paramamosain]|uniref:Uncharacterized protein n=1 Tax=Scylla paramamosain TaxID=85552 RepID=A0AAW0TBZ9_SCYPA
MDCEVQNRAEQSATVTSPQLPPSNFTTTTCSSSRSSQQAPAQPTQPTEDQLSGSHSVQRTCLTTAAAATKMTRPPALSGMHPIMGQWTVVVLPDGSLL